MSYVSFSLDLFFFPSPFYFSSLSGNSVATGCSITGRGGFQHLLSIKSGTLKVALICCKEKQIQTCSANRTMGTTHDLIHKSIIR